MSNENQDTSNIENTENVAEGGDEGKLKTLTNILKKCKCVLFSFVLLSMITDVWQLGMSVKDIANMYVHSFSYNELF